MKKIILLSFFVIILFLVSYNAGAAVVLGNFGEQMRDSTFGKQETEEPVDSGSEVDKQEPEKNNDQNPENEAEDEVSYLEQTVIIGNDGEKIVTNLQDILVLVNKERNLPADYEPPDLVKPDIPFYFDEDLPKKLLKEEAARAAEKLFQKAADDGLNLLGASGYRSYQRQKEIFSYWAKVRGEEVANKTSAYPGQSEHQTGLAFDVTSPGVDYQLIQNFAKTPEGEWLAANAPDFGFIIRYPQGKEAITGYSYEPWHIRYVRLEPAQEITEKGITLEEFLAEY